jgi:hypothetical protein
MDATTLTNIISFLQRILNPAGGERFFASLGIKLPLGTFLLDYLTRALPLPVADQLITTINTQKDNFVNGDPRKIAEDILTPSSTPYVPRRDMTFTLFGQTITVKGDRSEWYNVLLIGGALILLIYFVRKH